MAVLDHEGVIRFKGVRGETLDAALEQPVQAADSSRRVAEVSRETGALLEEMLEQHQDQEHVNRLIARVDTLRDEVVQLRPAYGLAHHLNQTGTLKRVLADRAIDLDDFMEPLERQQKQIERDAVNVSWLGESAANVERLLRDAARTIGTDEKTTRAPSVGSEDVDLDTDAAQTAADALTAIVYFAVLFAYSAELAVIALGFLALAAAVALLSAPALKRNDQRLFDRTAASQSKLVETVTRIGADRKSVG